MEQINKYLWRGPRPGSLQELIDQEFKTVIDLESGIYEDIHEDLYEQQKKISKFRELIRIIDYHLSNIFPPAENRVKEITGTMFFLEDILRKSYIHCLRGKDRTGYICAAYRIMCCKWSYNDAVAEMYRLGFNRWLYWWWTFFLKKYGV